MSAAGGKKNGGHCGRMRRARHMNRAPEGSSQAGAASSRADGWTPRRNRRGRAPRDPALTGGPHGEIVAGGRRELRPRQRPTSLAARAARIRASRGGAATGVARGPAPRRPASRTWAATGDTRPSPSPSRGHFRPFFGHGAICGFDSPERAISGFFPFLKMFPTSTRQTVGLVKD